MHPLDPVSAAGGSGAGGTSRSEVCMGTGPPGDSSGRMGTSTESYLGGGSRGPSRLGELGAVDRGAVTRSR